MLQANFKDTALRIGDTLLVKYNVIEGSKTRIQTYEGILIRLQGRAENKMMTVRRIGDRGVGVERMWPLNAPAIVSVEVVKNAKKVRRSKLYFLRDITGRLATRI
jgi:large subunit ribosomal protein L19